LSYDEGSDPLKVVAIIQARMGSTRLPGKVMKEVCGKPLLEYLIERVRKSKLIHEIVIATSIKTTEQPIIDLCNRLKVNYFRGSEEDVLSRYYVAAQYYKADLVIRLTADNPLIDPHIIDKIISFFLSDPTKYDYVSNTLDRTYPRGLDTEVFSMKALEQAYHQADQPAYREHVTPYIYLHPEKFQLGNVTNDTNYSSIRLTVDTEEDFSLIKKIIETFHHQKMECFHLEDIIQLLQQQPDWLSENRHIQQKLIEDNQ
jgi:spore coat polysaccharide biosynthesis protein SpsF